MATPAIEQSRKGSRAKAITGRTPWSRTVRSTEHFSSLRSLIRAARLRVGLSIAAMAHELQCGVTTIHSWEGGRKVPESEMVPRLARFMGSSPDALQRLILAAQIDRFFRRGTASLEDLHRLVIERIEEPPDLRGSEA